MSILVRSLYFFGLGLLLTVVMATGVVASSVVASPKRDADTETRISANEMTYFASGQKILFTGAVHIIRPDFELWSDTLIVYLEKKAASASKKTKGGLPKGLEGGDVERIVAENAVRIKRELSIGTAKKVTYTAKTGVLTMEGSPSLRDGETIVTGHIIKYYTKEDRSEVIGAPGKQVQVVFPSSKAKKKSQRKTPQGTKP